MAKMKAREVQEVSRETVEQIAAIMGGESAAASALRDADSYGGAVRFYTTGYSWIVEKEPTHGNEHRDRA